MLRPSFEDSIGLIDNEIRKRKSKWNLTALAWLDFDDVAQIIRIHIYKKWNMYDAAQPLAPWVNTVISNQIRNLLRNLWGNSARPCLRCAAAEGDDLCAIYTKQCSDCPLYATWEKSKKRAHDVKLPVSLENHTQEVFEIAESTIDIEKSSQNLHRKMERILKPVEWRVYEGLYIKNLPEEDIAVLMGYRTSEKNRSPGYKQIKNIKKIIMAKVKKCLADGDVDVVSG